MTEFSQGAELVASDSGDPYFRGSLCLYID